MPTTYPSAWLLLSIPFFSSLLVRKVPFLLHLAIENNRQMRPIGVLGLTLLLAGLVGLLPTWGLPLALLGGAVSGFAVFSVRGSDSEDDEGGQARLPDEPPPAPDTDRPIDWRQFDRLRARWERRPVPAGRD